MKALTYSFYNTDGYSGTTVTSLAAIFDKYGLKPVPGEFGSGGEQLHQVIAWLNIHRDDIAVNLLSGYIIKILNDLWCWHKEAHFSNKKIVPVVTISVHVKNKISITNQYPINKEYSKDEIKIVEESVK